MGRAAGSDQAALVGHGHGLGADGKLLEVLQGGTSFDVYSWTIT